MFTSSPFSPAEHYKTFIFPKVKEEFFLFLWMFLPTCIQK